MAADEYRKRVPIMVMLHLCIACQYGDHASHIPVPGPVPEGMIGGWECPCTGDCKPPPPVRRSERALKVMEDLTDYAAFSDMWPTPKDAG